MWLGRAAYLQANQTTTGNVLAASPKPRVPWAAQMPAKLATSRQPHPCLCQNGGWELPLGRGVSM
eukprot:2254547-Amphidinium_carterae.1